MTIVNPAENKDVPAGQSGDGRPDMDIPRGEILAECRDMGVYRDGRWLVRNVDIAITRGEIVTLVGPNGSGKSTIAKVVLGILKANRGDVRRRPGLRIGYVPQSLVVDATLPLTVRRLMTLTGRHDEADITAALEATGISHLADAGVQVLSGGEFQRALIARAILGNPDLLVLDEPVQGVDFAGEVALYELIRDVRDATNCGVLLISHDLHLVMADSDHVICVNGHVCCQGTPQAVAGNPEFARLFGARAADTLAVYQHHHDHAHLPDGSVRHGDGSTSFDLHQHGPHCDHDDKGDGDAG
jgi:zinc transport system ATP-binding protein